MIAAIIEYSMRRRSQVILIVAAVSIWGLYCLHRMPVDAIPDLSENQVTVWTDWHGRSPKDVEDQVSYPLSVSLQGLSGVKAVRASSEFGFSMITVVFEDDIELEVARQRIVEKLATAAALLPPGVAAYLGTDASALGQIYWYTVEGDGRSLDELRALQDTFVRPQLQVEGVAEVASIGGFVREFQVSVDPGKLRAFDVTLGAVADAVMRSNASIGAKVLQSGGAEYLISAVGWIRGLDDLRKVVVAERHGIPITVEQLGSVRLGPAFRRGMLEKDGGEAVGGVVVMRHGQNPRSVIEAVEAKIRSLQDGLPQGVRIVPFYDRTGLVDAAMDTLTATLLEEILIASAVVFLVLRHVRSAVVICLTLLISVLISFILMYYCDIPSNIMSLSGILISIGVLVDSGIVMTENAHNRLQEKFAGGKVTGDTRSAVLEACQVVGGPLFFSIVIMLLSFAPLFLLGGLEGRMFTPLAATKTFALAGVAVLVITFVPALLPSFVRGRLKSQQEVRLVRSIADVYERMLHFFFRNPDVLLVLTGLFIVASLPIFPRKMPWILFVVAAPFVLGVTTFLLARRKILCLAVLLVAAFVSFTLISPRGEEFMPPLDELSLLDMPVTRPGVSITQAASDLERRNEVLRGFPEAHQVVGKLGRAETPTDPAPLDMVETIMTLHPKEWWPRRKVGLGDALVEARAATQALLDRGILKPMDEAASERFIEATAGGAVQRFDRLMRAYCSGRLAEAVEPRTRELVRCLRRSVVAFLAGQGALADYLPEASWAPFEDELTRTYAGRFDEWILVEDVAEAARAVAELLEKAGAIEPRSSLWVRERTLASTLGDLASVVTGRPAPGVFEELRDVVLAERDRLVLARARQLDWEIRDRARRFLIENAVAQAIASARDDDRLAREPGEAELREIEETRLRQAPRDVYLERKLKSDLVKELDSDLQVPGWSNIWTQPIINRIDMLSTGIRTEIGVKVFGEDSAAIQAAAKEIAAALEAVPGAADVTASQIADKKYLEISIDRRRAARYGLDADDVQSAVELALGAESLTLVTAGRERIDVRVGYGRDFIADEEALKSVLVSSSMRSAAPGRMGHRSRKPAPIEEAPPEVDSHADGAGAAAAATSPTPTGDPTGKVAFGVPLPSGARRSAEAGPSQLQVPLASVADVRVVPGPSMIQSENGRLCTFVSLNVRGRDIVGFVEEARRVVEDRVNLPRGCSIEWSGQFEHQLRAQRTLTFVLPIVVLIIFIILFLTYHDFPDTLMMFLALPGAVAGAALFQFLLPELGVEVSGNFSVAVWVGYIACFGLATETSIVMLVYLREAIARRGGIDAIGSEEEIKAAVIEGAVHRLRPKLLTESTTLLALIPMLWASGVGAEYMRPMAAPIVGGILVADEVIDILIPVLFYWDRCRRLRKRRMGAAG